MGLSCCNLVNKHYKKIGLFCVGEGENGEVWKVQDIADESYYSLKIFKDENLTKSSDIIKGNLEKVNHSNIVKYIDLFNDNDKLNIVMEFCDIDLKKYIDEHKKINEVIIYIILKDICLALKQIHSKNILHNNLKSTNIFITNDNKIKIGDINLSSLQIKEMPNDIDKKIDLEKLAEIIKVLLSKNQENSNNNELNEKREKIEDIINSLSSKKCDLTNARNKLFRYTKYIISKIKINDNDVDETSRNILNRNGIKITINIKENEIDKEVFFIDKTNQIEDLNKNNAEICFKNNSKEYCNFIKSEKKGDKEIILKLKNKLKDCSNMFKECDNIVDIDLSYFDTSEVTNMSNMFCYCNNLKNIDLSALNTQNVENINNIFYKCENLEYVDFSFLDISNMTNMSYMFNGCKKLKKVIISTLVDSNTDTNKTIDMSYMFAFCDNLEEVDLSKLIIGNKINMDSIFNSCIKLNKFNLGKKKITNMISMFENCENLKEIDLSLLNIEIVEDMSLICKCCTNLETIKFPSNIGNIKKMEGSFAHCNNLETIDLSSFNFQDVDFREMFASCNKLKSIKFKKNHNKNLIEADSMLKESNNLKSIDLSDFNLDNLKSYKDMFNKEIKNIEVRKEDRNKVQNICEKNGISAEVIEKK